KTSIFSHPVYLFLRKFSLQDSRGGSNCVSFFDYRCYGTKHWEEHAYKCFPTQFIKHVPNDRISILFLHESKFDKLIPWTAWKAEEAWSDRVVPYVETGYKGIVSLSEITEELIVGFDC
ncbi:hypothetical protein VSP75_25005, partial [Escherichia coli]|nr:hypothetical protein [Escherichia coli]MEC4247176.1 hypothetical protein [Escherichia coli]